MSCREIHGSVLHQREGEEERGGMGGEEGGDVQYLDAPVENQLSLKCVQPE